MDYNSSLFGNENLSCYEWQEIIEAIHNCPEDSQMAIRVEMDANTDTYRLYGVYYMTNEEVEKYYKSGGIWTYEPKDYWIQKINNHNNTEGAE